MDADTFTAVLEGRVPDGPHLGKRGKDGEIHHRPGRDVILSASKSVSVMALVRGDERIVEAHDRAVRTTLSWVEKNAILTRIQDRATGAMVHVGNRKMVASTFRHDTSRNLDPQLHTHCVVANMVQDDAGKWRTMVNDGLFRQQKAIGAIYRAELAQGLKGLGYEVEKTHADGRFEIAGVPREVSDAFSTRRAEAELRYGVAIIPAGKRRNAPEAAMTRWLEQGFRERILSFDSAAARVYAQIAAERRVAGRPISEADCRIAAICRSEGAVLISRNVRNFEDSGGECHRSLVGWFMLTDAEQPGGSLLGHLWAGSRTLRCKSPNRHRQSRKGQSWRTRRQITG